MLLHGDRDDYFQNPSFSPDGRQMTFARWAADVEGAGGYARLSWRSAAAAIVTRSRPPALAR